MKLLSCIAFHYRETRLGYLHQVLKMHALLADCVHVVITTNTNDAKEIAAIQQVCPAETLNFKADIAVFDSLPSPWLLPWAHKVVLANRISDASYSHFMYSEDDIELSPTNVAYWLAARQELRPLGLFPSFLRVEWSEAQQDWTSTDVRQVVSIKNAPRVEFGKSNRHYINLPSAYQGMFFYDRELMMEHAASVSFDIRLYGQVEKLSAYKNWPGGGVAERASEGLTYIDVPDGHTSRNVVPYFSNLLMIDPACFIRHLANNYADNPLSPMGKMPVRKLLVQ